MTTRDPAAARESFGPAVENRRAGDFPFFDGSPTAVSTGGWVVVLVASVVGYAVLLLYPAATNVDSLVPRILFTAIPLSAFIVVTRRRWTAILRPVGIRDVGLMVLFFVLNLLISSMLALIVAALAGTSSNPATAGLGSRGGLDVVAFYLGTAIQLFGEELFTILPFLAVLYWLHAKAGLPRNTAVLLSWLITAVWFGLAHLPTYDFNLVQALVVIGGARLVLTLAYIRTKNLAVSFGAHLLNDWGIFTITLVVALARR